MLRAGFELRKLRNWNKRGVLDACIVWQDNSLRVGQSKEAPLKQTSSCKKNSQGLAPLKKTKPLALLSAHTKILTLSP
jgi:hypothetical protein